jgi:NAD(P)-dependent dehydrogenase (short-subunit alcohol dehydrogenase family)
MSDATDRGASTGRFSASSTTDEVLDGVDLRGRVAAVTGASGGLGLETARALAANGAHVVLVARRADQLAGAVTAITAAHPDASLDTLVLDLADVTSCRRGALDLLTRIDRLDIVVNNAGVMCTPHGATKDGFETQFGTNHLGHMAWTVPLLDLLTRSAPSRIVNLSSAGHRFGDIDLDDPNFHARPYDPWAAYGASKTANVLFSVELERRFGAAGVRSAAVHPGGIHTDLGRHMTAELRADMRDKIAQSNPTGLQWKSVPQGAATSVWAATVGDDARPVSVTPSGAATGVYCQDCSVAPVDDGSPEALGGVLPYAVDVERAGALWDLSLRLLASV